MKRVVFDTNIFVDWMRTGAHEEWILGADKVRVLSSVVEMELRAGAETSGARSAIERIVRAHATGARVLAPSAGVFARAGDLLRRLSSRGIEVRRAALVHDVLIALSARSIGATVVTRDIDFQTLRRHAHFELELVSA